MERESWHGTRGGYDRHRCRCHDCRAANSRRVRENRARRLAAQRLNHGTRSAYDAGCRCENCRRARWPQQIPHWWREWTVETWWLATCCWEEQREAAGNGWATETAEFEAEHPRPTFKETLIGLSGCQSSAAA